MPIDACPSRSETTFGIVRRFEAFTGERATRIDG